jgi:hypothetical protein
VYTNDSGAASGLTEEGLELMHTLLPTHCYRSNGCRTATANVTRIGARVASLGTSHQVVTIRHAALHDEADVLEYGDVA